MYIGMVMRYHCILLALFYKRNKKAASCLLSLMQTQDKVCDI